jgi:hypothetical protein
MRDWRTQWIEEFIKNPFNNIQQKRTTDHKKKSFFMVRNIIFLILFYII